MSKKEELTTPVIPYYEAGKAVIVGGLTKREHFAGIALQGLLSHNGDLIGTEWNGDCYVEMAISMANKMCEKLEKYQEKQTPEMPRFNIDNTPF